MNEAEARAEVDRLNRESASGGRWISRFDGDAWKVARMSVQGLPGNDPARVATTAPPPVKPDPSQDVHQSPHPLRGF